MMVSRIPVLMFSSSFMYLPDGFSAHFQGDELTFPTKGSGPVAPTAPGVGHQVPGG